MRRWLVVFVASPVATLGLAAASGYVEVAGRQQPPAGEISPPLSSQQIVLNRYCVTCHNHKLRTAGLALDTMDVEHVSASADVWEKVIKKLRARAMPPVGRARPDEATYDALASWLETEIDKVDAVSPNPGRTNAFHRLNRTEYQNAIRDLLAIEIDVTRLLPADNTFASGFDNNADILTMSPEQLERYLSAARKISRLAIGRPPAGPVAETHKVPFNLVQDDRMGEDLPFGSRGGLAFRYNFPVDGEYSVKIGLHKTYNDYVFGMGTSQQLDVRLDGVRVKRFRVGGGTTAEPAPATYAANILGAPEWESYVLNADASLEVHFAAKAGLRVLGVSFERKRSESEDISQPRATGIAFAYDEKYDGNAAVESVTIGGPYRVDGPGDTPSRRQLLVCQPMRDADEEPCAKKVLSKLARRAYRRPASEGEVQTLLGLFGAGRDGGFDAGIERAIEGILVDPDFLFRTEREPADTVPGAVYRISDLELASRLSFFLWASIPDDALLDLAVAGKLKDPAILEQQVRRMLADGRSKALFDNFASQWLHLRNLRDLLPDPAVYPDFDENLRAAFQQETELFLESQLREDRSVVDLISANYTFVNERLARHYQIPNIHGDRFRRVTFRRDEPRGGLLGQGSILTVTSYPNRTSPVLRGKWLLENILGAPPPEPPPNIPGLPENGEKGGSGSVRERLEQHRKNPICASCHAQMDPLGFALESFDAIGGWHATSEAEVSGLMPDGTHFQGPMGLRTFLLSRRDQFAGTVTTKLLAYALGRGLEYYDAPTVRRILRDAAPNEYRWSSLILGIVKSTPFLMRRSAQS